MSSLVTQLLAKDSLVNSIYQRVWQMARNEPPEPSEKERSLDAMHGIPKNFQPSKVTPQFGVHTPVRWSSHSINLILSQIRLNRCGAPELQQQQQLLSLFGFANDFSCKYKREPTWPCTGVWQISCGLSSPPPSSASTLSAEHFGQS